MDDAPSAKRMRVPLSNEEEPGKYDDECTYECDEIDDGSNDEEDGEDLDIEFDEEGRIAGVTGLDFTARSALGVLSPPLVDCLRREALRLHAIDHQGVCEENDEDEEREGDPGKSSDLDASFWLPASLVALDADDTTDGNKDGEENSAHQLSSTTVLGRNLSMLERVALNIFRLHTAGATFDASRSGAEWWIQVRAGEEVNASPEPSSLLSPTIKRGGAPKRRDETHEVESNGENNATEPNTHPDEGDDDADVLTDDEEEGPSIQFHYDKDEVLASQFGVHCTPQLSTVTYLSGSSSSSSSTNSSSSSAPDSVPRQDGLGKPPAADPPRTTQTRVVPTSANAAACDPATAGNREPNKKASSSIGAPTVIFQQSCGPDGLFLHPETANKAKGPSSTTPGTDGDSGAHPDDDEGLSHCERSPVTIGSGLLSFPRPGKHLVFDGRLLHGVPAELAILDPAVVGCEEDDEFVSRKNGGGGGTCVSTCDSDSIAPSYFLGGSGGDGEVEEEEVEDTSCRVTLLVNVWLNHQPLGIEPLEQKDAVQLAGEEREEGVAKDAVVVKNARHCLVSSPVWSQAATLALKQPAELWTMASSSGTVQERRAGGCTDERRDESNLSVKSNLSNPAPNEVEGDRTLFSFRLRTVTGDGQVSVMLPSDAFALRRAFGCSLSSITSSPSDVGEPGAASGMVEFSFSSGARLP